MKIILAVAFLIMLSNHCFAKDLIYSSEGRDYNQIHDEILKEHPSLRGRKVNGVFRDPTLRMYEKDGDIRVVVPDDFDSSSIDQIVSTHVIDPDRGKEETEIPIEDFGAGAAGALAALAGRGLFVIARKKRNG